MLKRLILTALTLPLTRKGAGYIDPAKATCIKKDNDLLNSDAHLAKDLREGRTQLPLLKLADGGEFIGIMLRSSSTEVYRDITGKERTFIKADILQRTELKTSLMPPGLVAMLTEEELRDLLAFVRSDAVK